MAKKYISGFVRDIETGVGIPGANVTVIRDVDNQAVPAGGMIKASANPMTTDANGFFQWETELSPGPVHVEATVSGSAEVRVWSGSETMQNGSAFGSDIARILKGFSTGKFKIYVGQIFDIEIDLTFLVERVSGQRKVTIQPGIANMDGYLFETHTSREIDIDPNVFATTRTDRLVLEQYIAGDEIGRQDIRVLKGSGTSPAALNTDPNIFQLLLQEITIAPGASTVNLPATTVPYAGPTVLAPGSVTVASLSEDVINLITGS